MTRRILTVAVAVLLAVLGALGVLDYAHSANQRALAKLQPVTAYVAAKQIPAGTPAGTAVKDGLLVKQSFPASSVPSDAIHAITSSLSDLVLTDGLSSGQMLLSPMLGASVQTTAALPIPPGMVAVTLQFCVVQAVGNYITPGSEIAVFNTFANLPQGVTATGACSGMKAGPNQRIQTRLVLPKVLVLAVGEGTATRPSSTSVAADAPTPSASSSTPSTPSTIYLTMAVSQANAERLIELGEVGSPYLALVTSASGAKPDVAFKP